VTGSFVGTQIVDATYALVCAALSYGSDVFGIKLGSLAQSVNSALGSSDNTWETLCEDCPDTEPFTPVITHNVPCSVGDSSSGTVDGQQSANVWRMSSSSYVEAGTQGISFADVDGRLFKITTVVKVSGADISAFTVADNACVQDSGFNLDFGDLEIKNIVVVSTGNVAFTYDFTVVLV